MWDIQLPEPLSFNWEFLSFVTDPGFTTSSDTTLCFPRCKASLIERGGLEERLSQMEKKSTKVVLFHANHFICSVAKKYNILSQQLKCWHVGKNTAVLFKITVKSALTSSCAAASGDAAEAAAESL